MPPTEDSAGTPPGAGDFNENAATDADKERAEREKQEAIDSPLDLTGGGDDSAGSEQNADGSTLTGGAAPDHIDGPGGGKAPVEANIETRSTPPGDPDPRSTPVPSDANLAGVTPNVAKINDPTYTGPTKGPYGPDAPVGPGVTTDQQTQSISNPIGPSGGSGVAVSPERQGGNLAAAAPMPPLNTATRARVAEPQPAAPNPGAPSVARDPDGGVTLNDKRSITDPAASGEDEDRNIEGPGAVLEASEEASGENNDELPDQKINLDGVKQLGAAILRDVVDTVKGKRLTQEEAEQARRAAELIAYGSIAGVGLPPEEREHLTERVKRAQTTLLNLAVGKNVELQKAGRDTLYRTIQAFFREALTFIGGIVLA